MDYNFLWQLAPCSTSRKQKLQCSYNYSTAINTSLSSPPKHLCRLQRDLNSAANLSILSVSANLNGSNNYTHKNSQCFYPGPISSVVNVGRSFPMWYLFCQKKYIFSKSLIMSESGRGEEGHSRGGSLPLSRHLLIIHHSCMEGGGEGRGGAE